MEREEIKEGREREEGREEWHFNSISTNFSEEKMDQIILKLFQLIFSFAEEYKAAFYAEF